MANDTGFLVHPSVDEFADTIQEVINGETPATNSVGRAQQYDWDTVAAQAEEAYQAASDGTW